MDPWGTSMAWTSGVCCVMRTKTLWQLCRDDAANFYTIVDVERTQLFMMGVNVVEVALTTMKLCVALFEYFLASRHCR